jgi:[acyl-carrier-protein] S-malonyltransferase
VTLVFMFPGQSSRDPGMFERLLPLHPVNREIFEQASEVLGRNLRKHYQTDNPDVFATNRDVQVGVFLANHMYCESLRAGGLTAAFSLGLSLGEYNHLVHIGALSFEEAIRVVDERGVLYDAGPEGAMASAFPLDHEALAAVVERARARGCLEVAVFNSPAHHVLSGERAALELALDLLEREHFVEGVVIEPRVPMHSSSFEPVGRALSTVLQGVAWKPPAGPYLPNVVGRFVDNPGPADFVTLLSQHVYRPVRWRHSIDVVAAHVEHAVFVEVGPRRVLCNLLNRKWLANLRFPTDPGEEGPASLDELIEELTRAA